MELWTKSYWPNVYDYRHYDVSYDNMHHYRQAAYQQFPAYRVPPVFYSTKSLQPDPILAKSAERAPPPQHVADLPRLDGSFTRGRCQVSPVGSESAGRGESTRERCSSASGTEKDDGGPRRDSTPDSTASDPDDSRSFCRVLTFQDQNGQPREMVFPKALDLDRPKRARTSFTSYQLERLEQAFKCNRYMVGRDRARLATNLDLTETQVKVWFQNRRTKYKREQCRAAEFQEKNAESIAACNILRLLQNKQSDAVVPPSVGSISPIQNRQMTLW